MDGDTASDDFVITVVGDAVPEFAAGASIKNQLFKAMVAIDSDPADTENAQPLELPEATGGNGDLTYSLSPDNTSPYWPHDMIFNAAERTLSGTPNLEIARTLYTYTVTDEDGSTASLMFYITVEDKPEFPDGDSAASPPIEPDGVPDPIADRYYITGVEIDEDPGANGNQPLVLPMATGGTGDLKYNLSPAVLGLTYSTDTLNNPITVSGTPTRAGEYRMTYTVTDTDLDEDKPDDSASLTFKIIVRDSSERPRLSTQPDDLVFTATEEIDTDPDMAGNQALTLPAADKDYGNPPYTYSGSLLGDDDLTTATGLSFSDAGPEPLTLSGTVSATITERMVFTVVYTVRDESAAGQSATSIFTITVNPSPAFDAGLTPCGPDLHQG